jgi:hypothetical protein
MEIGPAIELIAGPISFQVVSRVLLPGTLLGAAGRAARSRLGDGSRGRGIRRWLGCRGIAASATGTAGGIADAFATRIAGTAQLIASAGFAHAGRAAAATGIGFDGRIARNRERQTNQREHTEKERSHRKVSTNRKCKGKTSNDLRAAEQLW